MSATDQKKFACTCGRTFANEQILKYHQRVTNHGSEADANASTESQSAVPEAEEENPLAGLAGAVAVAARANAPKEAQREPEEPRARSPLAHARTEAITICVEDAPPILTEAQKAEQAYMTAIDIMRTKHAEHERLERRAATNLAIDELVDMVSDLAYDTARSGGQVIATGAGLAGQVLAKAIIVMVVLLLTGGMFTAGVGLVSLAAGGDSPAAGVHAPWASVASI